MGDHWWVNNMTTVDKDTNLNSWPTETKEQEMKRNGIGIASNNILDDSRGLAHKIDVKRGERSTQRQLEFMRTSLK